MATTLGTLIVRLGLDAAEFTTGLTKSEREAARFAKQLDAGIAAGAKAAGIALAALGTAAAGALAAIDQLAKQAGDFQDLAEMTGASAEGLASFAVAAGVAGTEMSTIANASVKLTKNLTGVDDESKAAGAALAALGLSIKDFKALAPEEQMDTLAKALAGFEDGASKTAVAVALLGKSGAELLPFLKELAAEGGRQIILTAEQIRLADEYADAQARARAELNLYAQVAATQALPAINAVIGAAKEFIGELIGVDEAGKKLRDSDAIRTFAENAARTLGFLVDAGDGVIRVFKGVGLALGASLAARDAAMRGSLSGIKSVYTELMADLDALINKQLFSAKVEKQIADARRNDALRSQEDRGFRPAGNVLKFTGAVSGGKAAKETKETAESYKELERWLRESGRAFDDLVKAEQKALDAQADITKAAENEAGAIQQGNRNLVEEIKIIQGGEDARQELERARVQSAIDIKQEALATAQLSPLRAAEAAAIELQIDALRRRAELLGDKSVAQQLKKEAAELQDVKNMFSDMFADTFTDIINGTKSVEDAFKDLASSILQQINRIAAQQIANSMFGGTNSGGPDIFAVLLKLIGAGVGAAGGIGYGTAGSAIPIGPYPYASGTSFHPGGLAMVGEQGPEVVELPRGAKVYPNGTGPGSGMTVVNHFSVQGPVNRATENQIAQAAARGIARAGRR